MKRREFVLGASAAAAFGGAARAQMAGRRPVIGMLWVNTAETEARIGFVTALHAGLAKLGYVNGETVNLVERFGDGTPGPLDGLAAELVRLNVDVIVTGAEGAPAAARATKSIPIVSVTTADPVAEGLAASLAHPGGNFTGNAVFFPEIMAKRLERLRQAAPSLARVGVLTPQIDDFARFIRDAMAAPARALGVEVALVEAPGAAGYEAAFAKAAKEGIGGLLVLDHPRYFGAFGEIAAHAERLRSPTVGPPPYARAGGLIGYGVFFPALFRGAAVFVDKILKGAKPGDIPIQQASKFETVVNLKTARALGVEFPATLLAAADEVVE